MFRSITIVCVFIVLLSVNLSLPATPLPREGGDSTATTVLKPRPSGLTETELTIWNSPAFRKRFAESYLAETDIEPRVTAMEREAMLEILELISKEKMDDAIEKLEEEKIEGSTAVFDFTLGNIHFQREEYEKALPHYEKAVEKYPKFRRAWRLLGQIHVRDGAFEKAAEALTRVIELGGSDPITYGMLGFAYSNLENYISAESAYRMATLLDPVTFDWKKGLVISFFKQERFAEAAALAGNLIAVNPDRADLWMLQANAFIGLGNPLKAAENIKLVDHLGKANADSLNLLGDIYINEGLYDLAVDAYIRSMEKKAQGAAAVGLQAAKNLTARGELKLTRRLLEAMDSICADRLTETERKDALRLRARIAVAEGAGDEEAAILEEIIRLDPLDGEALILLGQFEKRKGDIEKAIFYFERAASLEKYEADAKVRHAQLLVENERYGEALPLLRRAQALKPRENVQQFLEQIERIARSKGGK